MLTLEELEQVIHDIREYPTGMCTSCWGFDVLEDLNIFEVVERYDADPTVVRFG